MKVFIAGDIGSFVGVIKDFGGKIIGYEKRCNINWLLNKVSWLPREQ